jgi:integrase
VEEVKQSRTVTEAQAIVDLRAGRVNGPLAWMVVDIALATGLRVIELSLIAVEDVDLKRGCMSVTRLKRRKPVRETPAIGKDLIDHLKAFLTWRSARVGDLFMSLIHTCELNGVNAFDYLTELNQHADELAASPADGTPAHLIPHPRVAADLQKLRFCRCAERTPSTHVLQRAFAVLSS